MLKTKKILMVEDENVIQRLVCRLMARTPYDVDAVNSVADAMERIERNAYHLLITDLRLPDGDGPDVIARFRARFPSSKVIVITGSLTPEALMAGVSLDTLAGCLIKPFDTFEFSAAVGAALGASVPA